MNRDKLIEFIADLSGPIDPEVLAGFGSELQNKRSKDPFYTDIVKKEWSQKVEVSSALNLLFDIASNPPEAEPIYKRFRDDWNYQLADLIFLVGNRDRKALENRMSLFEKNNSAEGIVKELRVWLEEENEQKSF